MAKKRTTKQNLELLALQELLTENSGAVNAFSIIYSEGNKITITSPELVELIKEVILNANPDNE